jgi:hypothetical protein
MLNCIKPPPRLDQNEQGRAIALIPLGALPKANATQLGDSLQVRAEWVGPTGEPYFEKKTVRCASHFFCSFLTSALAAFSLCLMPNPMNKR